MYFDFVERTQRLIGDDAVARLQTCSVLLFGLGGVGSYCAEALVRAGIGHFTIVDGDTVSTSNINRQLIALHSTVGQAKTEVTRKRMLDINPGVKVETYTVFYGPEQQGLIDFTGFDFVVDAIDDVKGKIQIIEQAKKAGVPVISCMGTGNRVDPWSFAVMDIEKTQGDPLARVMRTRLRKMGITNVPVLLSKAPCVNCKPDYEPDQGQMIASIAYVPAVAGLLCASYVVDKLIEGVSK